MNVLSLVFEGLKSRAPRLLVAWLVLSGALVLVFRVFGTGPLQGPELTGCLIVSAALVSVVSEIARRMHPGRARRPAEVSTVSPEESANAAKR